MNKLDFLSKIKFDFLSNMNFSKHAGLAAGITTGWVTTLSVGFMSAFGFALNGAEVSKGMWLRLGAFSLATGVAGGAAGYVGGRIIGTGISRIYPEINSSPWKFVPYALTGLVMLKTGRALRYT